MRRRLPLSPLLLLLTALAACDSAPLEPPVGVISAPLQSVVPGFGADLGVTVDAPDEVLVGEALQFKITVANAGPEDAENVQLTVDLPDGAELTFTQGATCTSVGSPVVARECSIPLIEASEAREVSMGMRIDVPGTAMLAATVISDTPDPDASNDQASVMVEVHPSRADVGVFFTHVPLRALVGGTAMFQLNIGNLGPELVYTWMTATIGFSDDLEMPPSVSFPGGASCSFPEPGSYTCLSLGSRPLVICSYPGDAGAHSLTCRARDRSGIGPGSIGAGQVSIFVRPTEAGTASLQAYLHDSADVDDPNPANNAATAQMLVFEDEFPSMADLRLTKAAPASAQPGQSFDYALTVRNQGPDDADDTVITDQLPDGVTLHSTSGSTCSGETLVICGLGTLAPFEERTVTLTVSASDEGLIENTAWVESAAEDHVPDNNTATAVTDIRVPTADLELFEVTGPETAIVNREYTISWRLRNNGPDNATTVRVEGALPEGVSFVRGFFSTGSCFAVAGGFRCSLPGQLLSSPTLWITGFATLRAAELGEKEVELSATASQHDPDPDNATAAVTTLIVPPPSADLVTSISGPEEVLEGDPLAYSVTVTNHGPDAPTSVTLNTRLVTAAFDDIAATTSSGTCSVGTGTAVDGEGRPLTSIICSTPGLGVGATWTVDVGAVAVVPGDYTVFANSTSNLPDPDVTKNLDSFDLLVTPLDTEPPTVSASVSPGPNAAGWHRAPATVLIEAEDNVAVAEVIYDAGAGEVHVPGAVAEVVIEAEGTTTLSYRAVDLAGNVSDVGTLEIRLDLTPPEIEIVAPAAAEYLLGQVVTAEYVCTDTGSGVAGCAGPVAHGAAVPTGVIGAHTFLVHASDVAGNDSQGTVTYEVVYDVCLMYDPNAGHPGGWIVLQLQLCAAGGASVGTEPALVATDLNGEPLGQDPANPNHEFRAAGGVYRYALDVRELPAGTHYLGLSVDGRGGYVARFSVR